MSTPQKVTIIGLGLIGGSIALDLKDSASPPEIIGVDQSETHRKQALELRLADRILPLDEAIAASDLIILAIPVSAITKTLPHVLDKMTGNKIVTDVGSTKMEICKLADAHQNRKHYVASHPMAGTEHSGPTAALRGLFKGKAAVICDEENSDPNAVKAIEALYKTLEMRLIKMNSKEHDLHAAYVSHLSHISSFVLANTVLDKEKDVDAIFNLASGGFESTVRLAKSSPDMWTPIFEQNSSMIIEALGAYIERLKLFQDSLVKKDYLQTRKYMEHANEIKRVLKEIGNPKEKA